MSLSKEAYQHRSPHAGLPPDPLYRTRRKISFKHPGYYTRHGNNTLFSLFAWDSIDGGLHFGTALLACALVACNAMNGYLSTDLAGHEKVDLGFDDILPLRHEYFFHVPYPYPDPNQTLDSPFKYPVYARFHHWKYPHDIASHPRWLQDIIESHKELDMERMNTPAASTTSAAVLARDQLCLLSRHGDSLDRAHICPRSESQWFHENGMHEYNDKQDLSGDMITDDLANSLLMRCDLHRAFDSAKFAIVYKQGRWVAHFMEHTTNYASEHHNRPLPIPVTIAPQFLLARLAWTIFPRVKNFLESGIARLVRLPVPLPSSDEDIEIDKMLPSNEISAILSVGRGRSASPRKRTAPEPSSIEQESETITTLSKQSLHAALPTYQLNTPTSHSEKPLVWPSGKRKRDSTAEVDKDEEKRIFDLRKHALKNQRPVNPALMCCDYTDQGSQLCMQCSGVEVRDEDFSNDDPSM